MPKEWWCCKEWREKTERDGERNDATTLGRQIRRRPFILRLLLNVHICNLLRLLPFFASISVLYLFYYEILGGNEKRERTATEGKKEPSVNGWYRLMNRNFLSSYSHHIRCDAMQSEFEIRQGGRESPFVDSCLSSSYGFFVFLLLVLPSIPSQLKVHEVVDPMNRPNERKESRIERRKSIHRRGFLPLAIIQMQLSLSLS